MSSNSKKWIPILFAIKSSFKFPALATPNEVDRVMIDWWRMTSLQEYLKAFYNTIQYNAFLLRAWRPHCFVAFHFFVFFVEENSSPLLKQQLPKLEGFRDSWLDVTTHSETQTLFCTDQARSQDFLRVGAISWLYGPTSAGGALY